LSFTCLAIAAKAKNSVIGANAIVIPAKTSLLILETSNFLDSIQFRFCSYAVKNTATSIKNYILD
jgi:hypothetical protein